MKVFKNITNVVADSKIRVLILFLGIAILIVLAIAFTGLRSKKGIPPVSSASGASKVAPPPEIESIPGVNPSSEHYAEILRRANEEAAQKALKRGESFMPTPLAERAKPEEPKPQAKKDDTDELQRLAALSQARDTGMRQRQVSDVQRQQQAMQEYQKREAAQSDLMGKMADRVLAAWEPVSQQITFTPCGGKPCGKKDHSDLDKNKGNFERSQSSLNPVNPIARPADLKAGDIIFAVMITSVNSDEPGPIMARVVSGEYNGAKLVGRFTVPQNGDRMILEFNIFNIQNEPQSYAINAVAIDPDTARTALATSVNHHYMLRYGSFFAANFLAGIAEAIALPYNAGNTAASNQGTGNTIVQEPGNSVQRLQPLNGQDTILYSLGKMGSEAAKQMNFLDRPPTVKIACGTPVGILFQSDFTASTGRSPVTIDSPLENASDQAEFTAVERLHLRNGPSSQTKTDRGALQKQQGYGAATGVPSGSAQDLKYKSEATKTSISTPNESMQVFSRVTAP